MTLSGVVAAATARKLASRRSRSNQSGSAIPNHGQIRTRLPHVINCYQENLPLLYQRAPIPRGNGGSYAHCFTKTSWPVCHWQIKVSSIQSHSFFDRSLNVHRRTHANCAWKVLHFVLRRCPPWHCHPWVHNPRYEKVNQPIGGRSRQNALHPSRVVLVLQLCHPHPHPHPHHRLRPHFFGP